jgi:CheY-like chemotaxis protein
MLVPTGEAQSSMLEYGPPRHSGSALRFFPFMASVLLIDGDRNFREALAIALRLDGCAVTSAADGTEALPLLQGGAFDLCLVDLNVRGVEALLGAASALRTLVLVTGPYSELLEAAARRFPPVRALPKPFAAADLLSRLPRLAG